MDKLKNRYVGIKISDSTRDEIIQKLAVLAANCEIQNSMKWVAPVHVGSLKYLHNAEYVETINKSEFAIADGIALVILAKLEGAKSIERCSTTDFARPLVQEVSKNLNRKCRVALLGGPRDLAADAAQNWQRQSDCIDVVLTESGFNTDLEWIDLYKDLDKLSPDVIFLGLGQPLEFEHLVKYQKHIPAALVVPCGGLFGFISNKETRAPYWMQSLGLEWIYRLSNSPKRLFSRYARGTFEFLFWAVIIIKSRISSN